MTPDEITALLYSLDTTARSLQALAFVSGLAVGILLLKWKSNS